MELSRKLLPGVLALFIAGWAVYCYNPFALYFQNDDFTHILLSSKQVWLQRNSFRPVCDLSVMLDQMLWGNNAAGYHFTNLVLHIVCSLLVYVFGKRIFKLYYPAATRQYYPVIAGLLFLIYPLHSESVFWILGRSGTLGAIFSILFLLFFIKPKYTAGDMGAYILFYITALLTYESSWALPLVSVALLAGVDGGIKKVINTRRLHFITIGVIFLVYLFFRWKANEEILDTYEAQHFLSGNIGVLAVHFLQLTARSFTSYLEAPLLITAGFGLTGIIILYCFFSTPGPAKIKAALVFIAFLCCLLPCLSLGVDTHGTEGERFLYLPSVFVCIFIAIMLSRLAGTNLQPVFTGLFLVVYAAQLYVNAGNYRLAGSVVKQTMDEINAVPGKTIIIQGLPQAQHGALVLAHGLPDALQLLDRDSSTVVIRTKRDELKPLLIPYRTVRLPISEDSVAKFIFTDTALVIYR